MAKAGNLFLYEELMLLALKDEKGTLEADGTRFVYTMGAAFLSELLLQGRIRLEAVKKKKMVELAKSGVIGDPLLDECLERIRDAKRRADLNTWVTRFGGLKKMNARVAQQLCRRGILRADEDKVLLVFSRKIYPEVDPRPEKEVVERLRDAIFSDTSDVDVRTAVLVSLAEKAGLLKNAFGKDALKDRKARLEHISEGNVVSSAAKEVIESVQTAMAVVTTMTAITTATS